MNVPNGNILKFVLDNVPPGFFVDTVWLKAHGVAKSSYHDYGRSGWLEPVARGLYKRPAPYAKLADGEDWLPVVLSAQSIMHYDFHVGGRTALALDGNDHYLSLGGKEKVYLYGDVPGWLTKLEVDAKLYFRRRQLFGANPIGVEHGEKPIETDGQVHGWRPPLLRSSPERAILEMLNELPDDESFHNVDMAFEGLTGLRPRRLDELLAACKGVKAKRLFLLFADRHQHKWLAHIDREAINIGTGPRMLVHGGKYVQRYELVVPPEFAGLPEDDADGA